MIRKSTLPKYDYPSHNCSGNNRGFYNAREKQHYLANFTPYFGLVDTRWVLRFVFDLAQCSKCFGGGLFGSISSNVRTKGFLKLPKATTIARQEVKRSVFPSAKAAASERSDALFRAAKEAAAGCIIETGGLSDDGVMALCMGSSIGSKLPIYVACPRKQTARASDVDARPGRRAFRGDDTQHTRLLRFTDRTAFEGWQEPVSVLVIDGGTDRDAIYANFKWWRSRLLISATVIFIDIPENAYYSILEMLTASGDLNVVEVAYGVLMMSYGSRRPSLVVATEVATSRHNVLPQYHENYALNLEKVGYQIYYGGNGSYLYQPITKCGCTTVKTLLLQVEGLQVDRNAWRRHQKEYHLFPGTNHLSFQDQLDVFQGRTDTFKFVFVRNPYARLASSYFDKIRTNPAAYLIRKIVSSAAAKGIELSYPMTFEQFVAVVAQQPLAEMDPHCRPQYYEGRFGIVKYDFIGRMESMSPDLTYVLKELGAPKHLMSRVDERHNSAASNPEIWQTVSSEVRGLFLKKFVIDFDTLHYDT